MAKEQQDLFFQIPAQLKKNGIKTMADGGLNLTFETGEVSPAEFGALSMIRGKHGQVAFITKETPLVDSEIDQLDVPDVTPEFAGEKSPSQRLRSVLYRLWEQKGEKRDFEVFYRTVMDRIIEQYKEKLT
jgi:hypothetical protein